MMYPIASTKLSEVLKATSVGERVNEHVVESVTEPRKDRYLRQLLIRDIEELTKRRLVVYFANRFLNAQIDARDCIFMTELFGDVGSDPVDLLLETVGGETDATESVVTLLQNLTSDFRVVVANAAKSNGTLLCLASKSIVMGATSELGKRYSLLNSSSA